MSDNANPSSGSNTPPGFYPSPPSPPPDASAGESTSPELAKPAEPSVGERLKPAVDVAKATAQRTAEVARDTAKKTWPIIQPILERGWLNARIWAPGLSNPDFRARQVIYAAREARDGTQWVVELPQLCWYTGQAENLVGRTLNHTFRSFEAPIPIIAAAGGVFLLFALLWFWLGGFWLFNMMILSSLGGAAVLWFKSWPEHVRLTIFSSPERVDQVPFPEAVVYDNCLYLILPSNKLAEAARAELVAKRRAANAYGGETGAAPPRPPSADDRPHFVQPQISNYKREELPPIKLDDE